MKQGQFVWRKVILGEVWHMIMAKGSTRIQYFLNSWIHGSDIFLRINQSLNQSFPNFFFFANPFWLRKLITDPHIIADVNTEYQDDTYPKLKIFIPEMILDSYEHIVVAYVTMHRMIWS
jgi:hypothetical protein